nr:hypothetical protein [uncultured Pseudomonas sp.]
MKSVGKGRRSRRELELVIQATQPWQPVLTDAMSSQDRELFNNRLKAITLYSEGDSLAAIYDTTGMSAPELHRLIRRSLSSAPDGFVWGSRALIPHARLKSYERHADPDAKSPQGRTGHAGALGWIFKKYPELEQALIKKILKLQSDKEIYEYRIRPMDLHHFFIRCLEKKQHPKHLWPFNTKLLGSRSINTFLKETLDKNFDRGVLVRGEATAQAHLAVGTGTDAALIYEGLMDSFQIDSYHIDAQFSIGIETADGIMVYETIDRLNILAMLETASTAVWWFKVIYAREVSASDVVALISESMRAELPKPKTDALGMTLATGSGFPTELFPQLAHSVMSVLRADNALANLATSVSQTLRKKLGFSLCFGAPGHFEARPDIERKFLGLTKALFQRLPSTTGSGPGKGRAKDGAKIARELKIDATLIEEMVYHHMAHHNAIPSEGLDNISPIQFIRAKLTSDDENYVPRTLLKGSVDKITNYTVRLEVAVKCYPEKGIRPFIQLDRVRYSSDLLHRFASLRNTKITIEVDEQDMRVVTAYLPDGSYLDKLVAQGKWSRIKHSRKTRKQINGLLSRRLVILSELEDPVVKTLEYLREVRLGNVTPPQGTKLGRTKAGTDIARMEDEMASGMGLQFDEDENESSAESPIVVDDACIDESKPKRTATVIPYPMPDLNKLLKNL